MVPSLEAPFRPMKTNLTTIVERTKIGKDGDKIIDTATNPPEELAPMHPCQ